MNKIKITVDVTKIEKSKIKDGKYLTLEVVELKEEKDVTRKDGTLVSGTKSDGTAWKLVKTHFVSHESVKNVDGTWLNGAIVGEATKFEDVVPVNMASSGIPYPAHNDEPNFDVPF
jgi:hypothetical protein